MLSTPVLIAHWRPAPDHFPLLMASRSFRPGTYRAAQPENPWQAGSVQMYKYIPAGAINVVDRLWLGAWMLLFLPCMLKGMGKFDACWATRELRICTIGSLYNFFSSSSLLLERSWVYLQWLDTWKSRASIDEIKYTRSVLYAQTAASRFSFQVLSPVITMQKNIHCINAYYLFIQSTIASVQSNFPLLGAQCLVFPVVAASGSWIRSRASQRQK